MAAAVLGLDAVKNLYPGISTGNDGNYQMAALEATLCVAGEAFFYLDRKSRRHIESIRNNLDKLSVAASQTRSKFNADLDELIIRAKKLSDRPTEANSKL